MRDTAFTTLGNPYRSGIGPLPAASGNVANAVANAVMTPAADRRAFLSGLLVRGLGATAALGVIVTITGLEGGTLSIPYLFVAGVTTLNTPIDIQFPFPLRASADGQAITVSCPASGAGGTHNAVVAYGYQI